MGMARIDKRFDQVKHMSKTVPFLHCSYGCKYFEDILWVLFVDSFHISRLDIPEKHGFSMDYI